MSDHSESEEYVLEKLSFYCLGGRYEGKGILTWTAEKGFHIEAPVRRSNPLPERIELGKAGVRSPRDATTIRMKLTTGAIATTSKFYFDPPLRLLNDNHLSVSFGRVLFVDHWQISNESEWWTGSASYRVCKQLILPDKVDRQVTINGKSVEECRSAAGIQYEDNNICLIGHQVDAENIELFWNLSKSSWTKSESWKWPEEAQHALAILAGQTVKLLRRKASRPKGAEIVEYTEIRTRKKAEELLDFLKPIKKQPPLDRNAFVKLTEFLVKNPEPGEVCKKIFRQIADASRQQTYQGTELLLATILEAILRTLYKQPFVLGVRGWLIREYFERFRCDYLSDKWKDSCARALDVRDRLRHRNAHPDWLTSEGGGQSKAVLEQSIDDVVFLSTFYGYMIMAIAGFKDIEPKFPKPHKEWGATFTITQGPPPKADG